MRECQQNNNHEHCQSSRTSDENGDTEGDDEGDDEGEGGLGPSEVEALRTLSRSSSPRTLPSLSKGKDCELPVGRSSRETGQRTPQQTRRRTNNNEHSMLVETEKQANSVTCWECSIWYTGL
jgi:hypothetical protein